MKTKIFILLMILILAFSCSKNNPLSVSGTESGGTGIGENEITIASYAGMYIGKAEKTSIYASGKQNKEIEYVILVINEDSTAEVKTASLGVSKFDNFTKNKDNNYSSSNKGENTYLLLTFYDSNNVRIIFTKTAVEPSIMYDANKVEKIR
ncbi:hypothetical protein R4J09_10305 [Brachyspira intermedia]|uniref:hypothetical protein n=1 Tax=Brachyspira intermedia TaxID=84377 RepID=UPI0030052234